jgi:hypothetical protein
MTVGLSAATELLLPPGTSESPPQPANAANAAMAANPRTDRAAGREWVFGWQRLGPTSGIVRLLTQRSRLMRDIPVLSDF